MHLTIEKHGVIAGGYAEVNYNKEDLYFRYEGEVKISLGIATKKQKFDGSEKVSLEDMLSSNCKIGNNLTIKGKTATVIDIQNSIAIYRVDESEAKGTISMSLAEEIMTVYAIDIEATAKGIKAKIIAHI